MHQYDLNLHVLNKFATDGVALAIDEVLKSDLFKEVTGKFDLILSNPPQQKTETLNKADKEGKLITPKVASDGGIDGFDLYNKIKNQAKEYLTEDGVLVLQHDGYTNIYKYNEL